MKKQLHLHEVIGYLKGPDALNPISINFDDVLSYRSAVDNGSRDLGKTFIKVGGHEGGYLVSEDYKTVRKMMEDLRVEDIRPCYRIKIGYQVHYVPKNEVSHIAIDEENSHATLILKSGDKIKTAQTMIELRETSIEIPF